MGVMIVAATALTSVVYFPMWGGMFCGPREGATEQEYYLAEFTAEEQAEGLQSASLKFAYESKSERSKGGVRGAATDSHIGRFKTVDV
jgi:MFS transporter, NNP family, nitrate/nitrite transporter